MKLDVASLKKILRSKDAWVVIGGAAAAVTAIAVVSGRSGGGSSSAGGSYSYPDDQIGGASDVSNDSDRLSAIEQELLSLTSVLSGAEHPHSFEPVGTIAPISRSGSAAVPANGLPSSPAFVDRAGNPATVDEIMSQDFGVYVAPMTSTQDAPEPLRPAPLGNEPTTTYYSDRFGNRVTLDQLLSQTSLTNTDARQAPPVTAIGSAYAVPDPTPLYIEPIVARNIKTPGGALAYPGGGVQTYIGGPGAPLSGDTQTAIAA